MKSVLLGSAFVWASLVTGGVAEAGEVASPRTSAEGGGHGGTSAEPHHPGHREHRHYQQEEGEWVPHVLVSFKGAYLGSWAKHRERLDVGASVFGLGFEIAHGKLEFESVIAMGFADGDAGFFWEPGFKMPFHVSHVVEPFIAVGPVLSLGLEREAAEEGAEAEPGAESGSIVRITPEVGFVVGPGTYLWVTEHVGFTVNVGYRFIVSVKGLTHQFVTAGGLVVRY